MRVNLIAATRRVLLIAGVSGVAVGAQAYNACTPCQPAYIDCPPAMSVDTPPAPTPSGEAAAAPTPGQSDGVQPLAPDASVDLSPVAPPVSSVASSNRSQASFAPNMIGDTSQGGCGGLSINGATPVTLDHPIYACSRLNIAENNSAVVRDRVYFTYRHFHNASGFDIFSNDPTNGGRARSFDINQYLLAFEKRLNDITSVEFRAPLLSQLSSDLTFQQTAPGVNNLDAIGTDTEFGNISVILKQELLSSRTRTVSWGVGVNIPTAPDLNITVDVAAGSVVGVTQPVNVSGVYRNETVNVQPFLAYLAQPNRCWFTQGFLQCDVPVNQSTGVVDGNPGKLGQQVVLRTNFGIGRWLNDPVCSDYKTAALMELHYTGTLNGPDRVRDTFVIDAGPPVTEVTALYGPLATSTHSVNLVTGFATQFRQTSIYNGFGVPLTDGTDRGFDFEYSLTINRNF